MEHVGHKIKARREELHMTMEELALKLGYSSRSSIYYFEKSTNLNINTIEKIAAALHVPISYFCGNKLDKANTDTLADLVLDENLLNVVEKYKKLNDEYKKVINSQIDFYLQMQQTQEEDS